MSIRDKLQVLPVVSELTPEEQLRIRSQMLIALRAEGEAELEAKVTRAGVSTGELARQMESVPQALRAQGKAELAAELEAKVARAEKEHAARQRMDLLKDAVARGMLKPDEEQKIIQAAQAMGVSTGELLRQMESAAQAMAQPFAQMGEAMRKVAEAMASVDLSKAPITEEAKRLAAQERARKKLDAGQGIERLTTDELMSWLPKMAKEIPPLDQLTPLQLACLVQHGLNNCSNKQGQSTYDAALQYKHAPELIRRLLEQPDETPLQRMRMAWSLFRTGAATLDEIIPLMDRADDEAGRPTVKLAPHGNADGLKREQWCGTDRTLQAKNRMRPVRIPKALAVLGGELVADGIPYAVIKFGDRQHPNTVKLQELSSADNIPISGGCFWVDVQV